MNLATLAAPPTELTSKTYSATLPSLAKQQLIAFEQLKLGRTQPQILYLPKANVPYRVDTEPSAGQISCVLMQEHDWEMHHIGYWTRRLTCAEPNYSATEREGLAIVLALSV